MRQDGKPVHFWIEQPSKAEELPGGLTDPEQVSCSGYHCCAVAADDRALCWGSNSSGQLGNPDQGAGGESKVPLPVSF